MGRLFFLAALTLASTITLTGTSRAQIFSVYGTFSDAQFSSVPNTTLSSTSPAYTTTSYWAAGVGGGVTFGILPLGPIHIGLDLRGSTRPGTGGADTGMGGLRIALKLPIIRIKPFVEAAGGYIETRVPSLTTPSATVTNQYAGYEILGGVDYPLMLFIDFRVIEIGGGQAYNISTSSFATSQINLLTISTGAVLHF